MRFEKWELQNERFEKLFSNKFSQEKYVYEKMLKINKIDYEFYKDRNLKKFKIFPLKNNNF